MFEGCSTAPEENLARRRVRAERHQWDSDLEDAIGAASQANLGDDALLIRRREVDERDVAGRRHFGEPRPVGLRPDIAHREDLATLDGGQKLASHLSDCKDQEDA